MFEENEKIDCTQCGLCDGKCGYGLNVKKLLLLYNEFLDGKEDEVRAEIAKIPEEHRPDKCIGCGTCEFFCPEELEIRKAFRKFAKLLK